MTVPWVPRLCEATLRPLGTSSVLPSCMLFIITLPVPICMHLMLYTPNDVLQKLQTLSGAQPYCAMLCYAICRVIRYAVPESS